MTDDKMRAALERLVAAWDELPGGRHYGPKVIASWLETHMTPAIHRARQALATPTDQPATGGAEEHLRIKLPSGEGHAEVRPQDGGRFTVWIDNPSHYEGGYRSAWNLESFEEAVRNILGPVWNACLPFEGIAHQLPVPSVVHEEDAEATPTDQPATGDGAEDVVEATIDRMIDAGVKSDGWPGLPRDVLRALARAALATAVVPGMVKSVRLAKMYLETGFIECDQCGHEVATKNTDAEYELARALSAVPTPEGE